MKLSLIISLLFSILPITAIVPGSLPVTEPIVEKSNQNSTKINAPSESSFQTRESKLPNDKKIWGQTIEGCRMSAECDKEEYSYYEKIVLKITIENTTDKEIRYHDSFEKRDFIFSVKNEKGKDTPLTEYGKLVTRKDMLVWTRNVRIMLIKGQPMEYSVPINRMYDMSIGGKYTISVSRSVTDIQAKKKIEIKSNTISVKVSK